MKLIGKNSVSKYLSYFFYFLFIIFTLIGLYEILGFSVILYNEKTGSHFLSQTFYISQDVGWSNNFYTEKLKDNTNYIKEQLTLEEERFFKTISAGITLFNDELENTKESDQ